MAYLGSEPIPVRSLHLKGMRDQQTKATILLIGLGVLIISFFVLVL